MSSTGHLLVAQRLLGIAASDAANGYAIAIQAGAILAVLGLYRVRVAGVVTGLLGRNPDGLKLAINIVAAFLPAAVLGALFNKRIEEYLFGVKPVIAAWVVGGIVILALTPWLRRHREGFDLTQLSWRAAVVIGFAQWPRDVAGYQSQPRHHPCWPCRGPFAGGGGGVRIPARRTDTPRPLPPSR